MAWLLLLCIVVSCGERPAPKPVPPAKPVLVEPPAPAPDPVPASEGHCTRAGARLADLGCPQALTPQDESFAAACERALADGRDWRPDCIATVQSCDEVLEAAATPEGEPCR
jgi:hypothetical protein